MVNNLRISRKSGINSLKEAENLGVCAFGFLAGEEEYFIKFAQISGIDINDISEISDSPHFLGAVLAFLLGDDSMLLAFCQSVNCAPEDAIRAQHYLSEA